MHGCSWYLSASPNSQTSRSLAAKRERDQQSLRDESVQRDGGPDRDCLSMPRGPSGPWAGWQITAASMAVTVLVAAAVFQVRLAQQAGAIVEAVSDAADETAWSGATGLDHELVRFSEDEPKAPDILPQDDGAATAPEAPADERFAQWGDPALLL